MCPGRRKLRRGPDQKQLPLVPLHGPLLVRARARKPNPMAEAIDKFDRFDAGLFRQLSEYAVSGILVRFQGPLRELGAGRRMIEDKHFRSVVTLSDDAGTDLPHDPHG
jgi:hypothetical protein